jgi:tetratricopeptide (TPR) repeat protein
VRFEEFTAAIEAAEDQWQSGRWVAARDAYRDLAIRRQAELGTAETLVDADLLVIQRLADLSTPLGDTEAVDTLLAALGRLYRERGFQGRADHAAIKRLHLALGAERFYDAIAALRSLEPSLGRVEEMDLSSRGLARWETGRPWPADERSVLFSQLYLGMGRLLASLGQYDDALTVLERGLIYSGPEASPLAREAALPLRLALAAARLEKGDLAAAAEALETLSPDAREHPGLAVRRCELLCKLHLLRGNLQAAVEQLEQAAAICQERGFLRAALVTASNRAHVRILLNQTAEAERLLEAVAAGADSLGDEALARRAALLLRLAQARGGSLLGNEPLAWAVTEMQQGVADDAEDAEVPGPAPALKASPPVERSVSHLAFFEDRALGLRIQLARGDLDAAAATLAAIEQDFKNTQSDLIRRLIDILSATVLYYQGRYYQGHAGPPSAGSRDRLLQAEKLCQETRTALKELGLKPELYQLQRVLGWCLRHLERPAAERDALASENQRLLDEMADSLPPEQRALYLINKWRAGEEALAIEIEGLVQLRKRARSLGFWRRLALRWQLLRRLNALLDRIYREKEALAAEAVSGAPDGGRPSPFLSLGRRLALSPLRKATLAFLVLPDRVFLARVSWMSLDFSVSPLRRPQVRELVKAWHDKALDGPAGAGRQAGQELSDRLGLTAALAALPPRVSSLIIVPDDALHGLPFAALRYQDQYLVERYALSMSYQCRPRKLERRKQRERQVLVAGVDRGTGELPDLPNTGRQLSCVGEWLARRGIPNTPVLNEDASRSVLLERLPRASLCHISCHGVFQPDRPESTGLVLLTRDGGEEVLSLRDLSGLSLSRVRQVTLVSCWAADNYIFPGRWIVSLPEVLWRRGAASVLGCLWEVEDGLAVQFLQDFYSSLDTLPRDQALRRAQTRFLKDQKTSDPLWWAGFQLYGDPGALVL